MASTSSGSTPLTSTAAKAITFELGNRAHGSVSDTGSFYSVSSDTADAEPGILLKVEEMTDTTLYTMPPGLSMSRFIYQSLTSKGAKVPVSAYILWPYTAIEYTNGLPVVAWSHGTSGSNAQCPPSNLRNLWHHYQFPYIVAQAGYVVVATDYAGLGVQYDANGEFIVHEYLTGPAQANDLLFSITAARQAFPELSEDFVLVGSSQGGSSVWSAAQKLYHKPMPGYLGTVNMSPVTRFLDLPSDEAILPNLLMLMTPSIEMNYQGFCRDQIFTAKGVESVKAYIEHQGCNSLLFNLPNGPDTLKPDWKSNKYLQEWQKHTLNGRQPFAGPMLILQGETDPIVNTDVVTKAVEDTAAVFPEGSIEYWILPNVTHGPVMHVGSRIYLAWIADRFARRPAVQGLKTVVPKTVRPLKSYQPETNYILQLQTELWQAT